MNEKYIPSHRQTSQNNAIMFYFKATYILFFRSMQQLLDYPEDDVEETFCLNFTVRWKDIE